LRFAATLVGQYRDRKIHQIDPMSGAILRTLESNRFVTGVTWVDGELRHGTWEGEQSELPAGVAVSGLESDRRDLFDCGGSKSGEVRSVRRPAR
jgi:hypothetical protein